LTVLANRNVSFPLRADREIVIEGIKSNGDLLKYADASLKNDPELKKLEEG
jgi:hypothetical protein